MHHKYTTSQSRRLHPSDQQHLQGKKFTEYECAIMFRRFKEEFGYSHIKNSIILNDVYIGDNTVIENCIVESRDTIRANTTHIGTPENIKIVVEKNERYTL